MEAQYETQLREQGVARRSEDVTSEKVSIEDATQTQRTVPTTLSYGYIFN